MLFLPYATCGVTDHISLEGGISLIPRLGFGQFIYCRSKIVCRISTDVSLGGEFRVACRVSIATENFYEPDVDEEVGLLSYGLSFFGEQFSADACFVAPIGGYILEEIFSGHTGPGGGVSLLIDNRSILRKLWLCSE